ncbi:MAG: cation diffusion facilitator family transporter [Alphaproteobacteria bacterium]
MKKRFTLAETASLVAALAAFILLLIKTGGTIATESVGLFASLVDSSLDLIASFITYLGISLANKPADPSHRYGHGKAEAVSSFAQAGFMAASALFLVIEAISRFIHPRAIEQENIGIALMIFSCLVTLGVVIFQRYAAQKTGSMALLADSKHYVADFMMAIAVIIGLLAHKLFDINALDTGLSVIVGIYLAFHAVDTGKNAVDMLMDRELPDHIREEIIATILAHPQAKGLHDLRSRKSGKGIFAEFHLELDGKLSLDESHQITDEIEQQLMEKFPYSEFSLHQEPFDIDDDRLDHRIKL